MANKFKTAQVIALGGSYVMAGKEGGVSERTVRRWMKDDPEFKELVEDLRDEIFESVRGGLSGLSTRSLRVMEEILSDREVTPSVRARVALGIVRAIRDLRRDEKIEDRIAELDSLLIERGIK